MAPSSIRRLALLATAMTAQAALWDQCGGIGYQGSGNCGSGAVCTSYNPYYFQCVPGTSTAAPITTTAAPPVVTTSSNAAVITTTTSSSASASPTGGASGLKYFINFGDSYSQTGFNPDGTKPSASNPFGNPTLPGWTASGGLNWVGFLTSQYNASTLLTYNYAYGGATTNASLVTPYAPTVLSFVDQVAQFSAGLASRPDYAPWTAENTLVGVWMGVNDVGNSWWLETYADLVQRIMDTYFGRLQVLYDAGARKFLLLSVPPIQRTPAVIGQGADVQTAEAAAIQAYNTALSDRLKTWAAANTGTDARILDTWAPFNAALDNPAKHGAPDATCYADDGKSCLWFNDYHPGVEINRLVAAAAASLWDGEFFEGGEDACEE